MKATSFNNSINFAKRHVYPLVELTIPLILTGLIQACAYLAMNVFLARLGQDIFAAGAVVNWMESTLVVVLFGTLGSISVLVSHKHGAKNEMAIAAICRDGLLLSLILSLSFFYFYRHLSSLFLMLGQSPAIISYAESYLRALSWGLFPTFAVIVFLEVIIGVGDSRLVLILNLMLAILNVAFSYIFIFGKLGLPALGIAGAGWGVTVSQFVACIVCVLYMFSNRHYKNYFKNMFDNAYASFGWEIIKLGLPQGLMYSIEVGFFFALALCMGAINTSALAANQIAMQYVALFGSVCFAVAQAITVRMGYLIGAKALDDAKKVVYIGMILSFLIMLIPAISYFLNPLFFISIIINTGKMSQSVIDYAVQLLMLCGVFQVFEALRIALFGSLRALKDTKFSMLTSVICFWLFALPVGYWLAHYTMLGGSGFWIATIASVVLNIILLLIRMKIRMTDSQMLILLNQK